MAKKKCKRNTGPVSYQNASMFGCGKKKRKKERKRFLKEECPNIGPEHGPAHKKPLTFEEKIMKARPGMFQTCTLNIF